MQSGTGRQPSAAIGVGAYAPELISMNKALIIGYGNPLRSDDGLGWHASRLLARRLAGAEAEVLTCQQLTPELAEPLSRCRRAVFVDAAAEGIPGEIRRRDLRPEDPTTSTFTHSCSPAGLLANARSLYGHCPQAIMITVSAQSFAFGDTLTAAVSAALPKVVDLVCRFAGRPESGDPEF
jgi:hydrogenase maturation protease